MSSNSQVMPHGGSSSILLSSDGAPHFYGNFMQFYGLRHRFLRALAGRSVPMTMQAAKPLSMNLLHWFPSPHNPLPVYQTFSRQPTSTFKRVGQYLCITILIAQYVCMPNGHLYFRYLRTNCRSKCAGLLFELKRLCRSILIIGVVLLLCPRDPRARQWQ